MPIVTFSSFSMRQQVHDPNTNTAVVDSQNFRLCTDKKLGHVALIETHMSMSHVFYLSEYFRRKINTFISIICHIYLHPTSKNVLSIRVEE